MQFRPLIQRLTPWLTAYLLVVSVGLPLQRVYCACIGAEWITVIPEDRHQCQHDAAKLAKVTNAEESSCCAERKSCTDHHRHTEAGNATKDLTTEGAICVSGACGDTELLIAQLDADFTVELSEIDFTEVELLTAAVLASSYETTLRTHNANAPIRGPTEPPPLRGRDLLVAHQTFLI